MLVWGRIVIGFAALYGAIMVLVAIFLLIAMFISPGQGLIYGVIFSIVYGVIGGLVAYYSWSDFNKMYELSWKQ